MIAAIFITLGDIVGAIACAIMIVWFLVFWANLKWREWRRKQ